MIHDIKYRLATPEDLPAMERAGDNLFDYPVKANRAREFLNDPRHHIILAHHHKQIVGMVSAFHYVHPDKDPALFINEASVIDGYQNNGIGRSLVRHMCEYGREMGCSEAWVATEESNVAARKAYTAVGGVEDKERVVLITFDLNGGES